MIIDTIVTEIINPLIRLLFGAGIIVFLWGMVEFLFALDDDTKKSNGKRHMIWGIIGLAIMVAVFGIINIIQATVDNFGIP